MKNKTLHAVIALLAIGPMAANAATLNVSGGQLLGASDVDIGGALYDVEFVDGSCFNLFSTCGGTGTHVFAFGSASLADAASQSLRVQVFGGTFAGSAYDDNPELTRGITDVSLAQILTGYNSFNSLQPNSLDVDLMLNSAPPNGDFNLCGIGGCWIGINHDTTNDAFNVYAQWTIVSPVPVPAALWLFGSGLGMLGWITRRQSA